jgi:hypothetical protein
VDASLRDLIEELRHMERRRGEATPGSSEYMDVLDFERRLVERIHEQIVRLDAPELRTAPPPEPRALT